ncbi:MAG: ribosome maturation factor RimM [Treponemataceae bacterium]|nr:ribosome maturation factor RimM [Treponemataceae bacterium]
MALINKKNQPVEKEQLLIIGIIRGTHGLAGKFKVESTSGECEHFFDLDEVTLRKDTIEKTYKVESVEGNVNSLIMKCAGINSPEDAKKLSGSEILVPRNKACPLNEGEFYVEDLKQCKLVYLPNEKKPAKLSGLAENTESAIIAGTITDVLEGGAGKLLEVELSESLNIASDSTDKSKPKRVLVPFKKEFIGTVDIKDKVIQLMHLWILE